jgi:hypothetical protein
LSDKSINYNFSKTLAQTEVKSPQIKTSDFSWLKRATKGSSFLGLEKYLFWRGIETECWIMLQKKGKIV